MAGNIEHLVEEEAGVVVGGFCAGIAHYLSRKTHALADHLLPAHQLAPEGLHVVKGISPGQSPHHSGDVPRAGVVLGEVESHLLCCV